MALFNYIRKKLTSENKEEKKTVYVNSTEKSMDKLTEDGNLPWGWVTKNKDFTEKIQKEFNYFLNNWLSSREKEPLRRYETLKSFVIYLEDVKKLCESKSECHVFWFTEILTSKGYLDERKAELDYLQTNFNQIDKDYKEQVVKQKEVDRKIVEMESTVMNLLRKHNGILQSEFWKLFDKDQDVVQEIVYSLWKKGVITKTKSGRSYILTLKQLK